MNLLTLENIKLFLMQLAEYGESVYWLGDPNFTYLSYVKKPMKKSGDALGNLFMMIQAHGSSIYIQKTNSGIALLR